MTAKHSPPRFGSEFHSEGEMWYGLPENFSGTAISDCHKSTNLKFFKKTYCKFNALNLFLPT